ncbi:hypothetical protein B0E50_02475 [Rhodanobacter sp. C01]|nr:hypothetical protein B0E50_02475 [Rhodanobacter sp. C01]
MILPVWLLSLLVTRLIALLADLNYRYLEQPLRERGRHLAESFGRRWKTWQLPVDTPALLPSPGLAGEGR